MISSFKTMQMARAARMVVERVLAVKPGEGVCIITDTERPRTITEALAMAAASAGAETVVVVMTPREMGGVEPPRVVAGAMREADAIVNQATYSLTHTNAEREALAHGARVCNLRGVDEDMMVSGGILADYNQVKALSEKVAALLEKASTARLVTQEGTDLTMSIEGRKAYAQTGFATKPGDFSGLPDGEATIAPVEGTTNGVIVSPYLMDKVGLITQPFVVRVENGRIVSVEGGDQATRLKEILDGSDENGRNLAAQLAIGTNSWCRLSMYTREATKKLGTVHIAVGDNRTLGGTVESKMHLDILFINPTLYLDDTVVLDGGRLLAG